MRKTSRKIMVKTRGIPVTGVLFFCFLLVCPLAGCDQKEVVNRDSKGSTIVCFGDSLTYGYGVERGSDYPTVLSRKVALPVINAGVNSNTTDLAKGRIKTDVLAHDPYIVVIEFGANDFMTKIPLGKTLENLRELIQESQSDGAMVFLVDVSAGLLMQEYRGAYSRLAAQTGAVFVPDVLTGIITNPRLKSDFVHPNAAGYDLIAGRIHKALLPYLVKKGPSQKIAGKWR